MHRLPPAGPDLPELPPLFWNRVNKRIEYWQACFAQPNPPSVAQTRKYCIARIKTRLKRIHERKNAGRSLFELSEFVACLIVIESRN